MVATITFSQFVNAGNLPNNATTVGLSGGSNAYFNNPWTFLPPGTTAARPTPSAANYYLLRLNTDTQLYEYYDNAASMWVNINAGNNPIPWVTVTTNTTMAVNTGYFTNNAGTIQLRLPGTSAIGNQISIAGLGSGGGLWQILTNGGQTIELGTATASTSITSHHYSDSINLICSVSNTEWTVVGGPQSQGLTII